MSTIGKWFFVCVVENGGEGRGGLRGGEGCKSYLLQNRWIEALERGSSVPVAGQSSTAGTVTPNQNTAAVKAVLP